MFLTLNHICPNISHLQVSHERGRRKMLAVKFFNSSHDENQETPWSQNLTVYKYGSFFKKKMNWGKSYLQSQFS